MTRPSPSELLAETARLAFHFHWPLDTLLDLEHRDRRAFLEQAEALAGRGSRAAAGPGPSGAAAVAEPAAADAAPGTAAPEVVDLDAIKDPRVRKLFETYYGGAA